MVYAFADFFQRIPGKNYITYDSAKKSPLASAHEAMEMTIQSPYTLKLLYMHISICILDNNIVSI